MLCFKLLLFTLLYVLVVLMIVRYVMIREADGCEASRTILLVIGSICAWFGIFGTGDAMEQYSLMSDLAK
jgi:hypothetical protein